MMVLRHRLLQVLVDLVEEASAAAGLKRQSAAIAAFSVALGLIAADVLAESGRK